MSSKPISYTKQFNPCTGDNLESVPNTAAEDVGPIIAKSRAAQVEWAKLSYSKRAKCVQMTKKYLADNCDRGARLIADVNGKTPQDALGTEILPGVMACDWYAKNAENVLASKSIGMGNWLFANKSNYLEHSPVGVVGIISPWNYPFSIPFGEVIMGLMAGNGIVLKVATPTTLVGVFIEECIDAGGFPEGLFAHIVVSGAVVSPEMFKAGVNKIFFTGSVGVGKGLMVAAAPTLTPLSLELGGKDPMVVLDDANLERATNCALWAGVQNAGQSCGGVERIFVHEKVYDAFMALICKKCNALRHGPSKVPGEVDMGSITTAGQLKTIQDQVDEAVLLGGKIMAQSRPVGDCSKGFFFPATIMANCTTTMKLLTDETFGPVLPVIAFANDEEAVRMANDCSMALTSSVFGSSGRAKKVASRLESGVVTINDHLYTHGLSEAPWGGWKESGLGRTHGAHGLREMTNEKCINTDMLPAGMIPRNMWWFPFSGKSYSGLLAGVHYLSPKSICAFWGAFCTLLPFAMGTMFTKWNPIDNNDENVVECVVTTAGSVHDGQGATSAEQKQQIPMSDTAKVVIFSSDGCPYCTKAKDLLQAKVTSPEGYRVYNLDGPNAIENSERVQESIIQKYDHATMPAVFINGAFIGGFSDLEAKEQSGELAKLLA